MCSILKGILKFYIVYFIFGSIALTIMLVSLGTIEYLQTGTSVLLDLENETDTRVVIHALLTGFENTVPFGALFELLLDDNGGILSSLLDFFKNFKRKDFSLVWETYAPSLLRDLSVASLASLIFFVLTISNKIFGAGKSFLVSAAFAIVSVLWLFASYTSAECVMQLLERQTAREKYSVLYGIILLCSFLIHTVSLAFSGKSKVLRVFILLSVQLVFNGIRAVFVWLLSGYLPGLFNFAEVRSSVTAFILVAFLLVVLKAIEDFVIKRTAYLCPR